MTDLVDRRDFLTRLAAFPIVTAIALRERAKAPRPAMTVYKSATCGCCKKWVEHVEKAGFKVAVRDVPDVDKIKKDLGVPATLASCHTAVLGQYLIEGHVPAEQIDKLLAEKSTARGLAVPGMPASSPGMDVPGVTDKYDVLVFTADGKSKLYARVGPVATASRWFFWGPRSRVDDSRGSV